MFILNTYTWLSLYYHLDMIFVKYCWIWHIKLPGLWTHSSHCTHLTFQSNQITVCTWVFPGWINTLHTMHARTQSDEALTASQDTMQPYEAAWGGGGRMGTVSFDLRGRREKARERKIWVENSPSGLQLSLLQQIYFGCFTKYQALSWTWVGSRR